MTKKKSSNAKAFALSSTLAALAGLVAGFLAAPKSGKEIRGDIKQAGEQSRVDVEKELKSLSSDLSKAAKEAGVKSATLSQKAKAELDLLVEKSEDTNAKVREILSAFHEGNSKDQDLKRAVQNAKSSLEHLKDYLKK